MAFYSYNKFRLLVLVLLALIFWQIFKLIPASGARVRTPEDNIELLGDSIHNKHMVDKVRVKVYYEALCPDSRHFFLHHLLLVSEKLADFVNISLIPYGKATTRREKGAYVFTCQHGEPECYANRIHACAVERLRNATLSVQFTTCMIMDNMDADAALQRCGREMNVETETIKQCATGNEGAALLKKYGDETHAIEINFIPTISLDDSLDQQALILKNFLLVVCQQIDIPLPPPCL